MKKAMSEKKSGSRRRAGNRVHLTKKLFNLCLMILPVITFSVNTNGQNSSKSPNRNSALLYVLDSKNGQKEGQIIVVESGSGTVKKVLKTGAYPDFAISPDGKRIYVTATHYAGDDLATESLTVVDAKSGKTLKEIKISNRLLYNVRPPNSVLALSDSGRFLYVAKFEVIGTNNTSYWMEIFDADKEEFLPERISLPLCGWTKILPTNKDLRVQVHCADTQDIRLIEVNERGLVKSSAVLTSVRELSARGSIAENIKAGGANVISGIARLASDQNVSVTKDGQVLEIAENKSHSLKITDLNLPASKWVHNIVGANNGIKAFLIVKPPPYSEGEASDEIISINLQNPASISSARFTQKIDYLTVSRDNQRLYSIDSEHSSLTIIDSARLSEIRTISNVGVTPSLVIEVLSNY
jgi:YVTN family beta-propeller protein